MVLQAGNLFQHIFASPLWQTKRQWIFLSPKFLAFWSGNVFQDISLLAAAFNVEKNNGCFRHLHVWFFVSRYLLVGVVWSSKSKGAFLFWFCVSRYLFVGGGVQNQKRRFVIVFCVSIYLFVGVVWCSKPEKAFCYHFPPLETNPYFCQLMAL